MLMNKLNGMKIHLCEMKLANFSRPVKKKSLFINSDRNIGYLKKFAQYCASSNEI